jgi:hypothetical protein
MRNRHVVWVLALAVVVAAGFAVQAADYVGADKCKMCHKVQYNSWEQTTHAKATEAAKASTDPAFGPDCLKCHATNGNAESMGVECEACHGPGSDYKKMSIMKDREAAVANGLLIPSQETCNGCHVDNGHSKAVDFKEQLTNKAAIHEFKNPPSH